MAKRKTDAQWLRKLIDGLNVAPLAADDNLIGQRAMDHCDACKTCRRAGGWAVDQFDDHCPTGRTMMLAWREWCARGVES